MFHVLSRPTLDEIAEFLLLVGERKQLSSLSPRCRDRRVQIIATMTACVFLSSFWAFVCLL